ncbi:hypothetical protein B0H14DRAFT_3134175 [Mycena olivaceomarginata]|nr:hypothetical protein B0H14DRAFT_3134175 [Mycena olivaceomarginata]
MSWVLVVESKHEEAAIPAFKASPSGIMCNSSTRAAGGNGANVGGVTKLHHCGHQHLREIVGEWCDGEGATSTYVLDVSRWLNREQRKSGGIGCAEHIWPVVYNDGGQKCEQRAKRKRSRLTVALRSNTCLSWMGNYCHILEPRITTILHLPGLWQILAAPAPAVGVKAEQQAIPMPRTAGDIKMRALNEGGREVLELPPDSDVESTSEMEVMEVLQSTSRSSSAIPTHSYCDNFRGQSNDLEFAEPIEKAW